jgi:IS5 family transposase
MFRVLVLQTLYTLSDEQTEYQLRDRLSGTSKYRVPRSADGLAGTGQGVIEAGGRR